MEGSSALIALTVLLYCLSSLSLRLPKTAFRTREIIEE